MKKTTEADTRIERRDPMQAYDYDPRKERWTYYRVYTITMLAGLATGVFGVINAFANVFGLIGAVIGTYSDAGAMQVISMLLLLALGLAECLSAVFLFKALKDEDGGKTKKSRTYGFIMLGVSVVYGAYAVATSGVAFMPIAAIALSLLYLLIAFKVIKPVLLGQDNA